MNKRRRYKAKGRRYRAAIKAASSRWSRNLRRRLVVVASLGGK